MAAQTRLDSPKQYTVAWIAALEHELAAATAVLDEEHDTPANFKRPPRDHNAYTWGRIGDHNVVIASLSAGQYGTTAAALTAEALLSSLPHIRFGLMVGIGAGVSQVERGGADVRLGDIIVSQPHETSGGVVQYDLFKAKQEGGLLTGHLAMPPEVLLKALTKLKAKHQLRDSVVPSILDDTLKRFPKMRGKSTKDPGYTYPGAEKDRIFVPSSQHVGGADCSACPQADAIARDERNSTDPEIHYGVIASGNTLVKDAHEREFILQRLPENVRSKCLCIEMEAAGLMNTFPCVVIRGICDYADSHKNDVWQKYAAATAAAFGKELLSYVDAQEVQSAPELREAVEQDQFNIPFSRQGIPVDNFVGREEQIQHIEQQLQPALLAEKSRRTVIVIRGLGGIGKTKLAANYAQLHQDNYSAIFWMDGSTRDSLRQSFLKAAERIPEEQLQVDPTQVDVQKVMASVLQWLSLPGNWKWLLVIDNVDREFQEPGKDEQGFNPEEAMPSSDHGSMLITSRLWSVKGTGKDLDLDRVNEDEAQAILTRHACRNITDSHLLLRKLDGLPLALAQAGSFIGLSNIGVKEYIQYFDETWSDLMQNHDRFPSQDYQRSMLTTWKISYDQVLRRSETAAWLLRLWAFFYHDDFWYGLLAKSASFLQDLKDGEKFEMPTWLAELAGSELGFSSAMALLKAYSLAESTGGRSYTMHSVLHRWSRSLSSNAEGAPLIFISICVLASATPSKKDGMSWKLERRLLQHVLHAGIELRVTQTVAQLEFPSRATHRLGDLLRHQYKLNDAEQMHLRALSAKEKVLGPNHMSTLGTVNNLGILYWQQGKLDESEQMYQRALHVYEKELGPNHTSTLKIVNNLGSLCLKQGKLAEAEQMFHRALTSYEKTYGTETLTVLLLAIVNNLGNLYYRQGRLDEAEKMFRRALAGYEKMHGKEALTIPLLDSVYGLGLLYRDLGRLDEAEQTLERVLAGYREIYGCSHKEVEEVLEQLAFVRSDIAARDAESTSETASAPDEYTPDEYGVIQERPAKRRRRRRTV